MDDEGLSEAGRRLANEARDLWRTTQEKHGEKFYPTTSVAALCKSIDIDEGDWKDVRDLANVLLKKNNIGVIPLNGKIQIAPRKRFGAAAATGKKISDGVDRWVEKMAVHAEEERLIDGFNEEMGKAGVTPAMIGDSKTRKRTQKLLEGRK